MRAHFFYGWVIVAINADDGYRRQRAHSVLVVLPSIVGEFHWERGLTAGAFSFGFVVSAAFSPLIGRMMDRFGPRVVMEGGVLLMAAGLLLAPLTTEIWHLQYRGTSGRRRQRLPQLRPIALPAELVRASARPRDGAGLRRCRHRIDHHVSMDRLRRARRLAFGLDRARHRLMLVVLVPINLMVRKRPQDMGLLPDGDDHSDSAAMQAKRATVMIVDPREAATDWTLSRALRTAPFWWLSLGFFCGLYSWYAVQVHQTKYLVEVGFSSTVAVWALGAVGLLGIPSQIVLGGLSDRIGREWIWTISGLGFVICLVALIGLAYVPQHGAGLSDDRRAGPDRLRIDGGDGRGGRGDFRGQAIRQHFRHDHAGGVGGRRGGIVDHRPAARPIWRLHRGICAGHRFPVCSAAAIWFAAPRKVRAVAGRAHLFDQHAKTATSDAG